MITQANIAVRELGPEDLDRVSGGAIGPEYAGRHIIGPEVAPVRGVVGPEFAGVRGLIGPEI